MNNIWKKAGPHRTKRFLTFRCFSKRIRFYISYFNKRKSSFRKAIYSENWEAFNLPVKLYYVLSNLVMPPSCKVIFIYSFVEKYPLNPIWYLYKMVSEYLYQKIGTSLLKGYCNMDSAECVLSCHKKCRSHVFPFPVV